MLTLIDHSVHADDLRQYCDELENTAVWGGQLEVCALIALRVLMGRAINGKQPHRFWRYLKFDKYHSTSFKWVLPY
jgi:hypothetical protein